jgi:hypothetical protein
MQFLLVIGLAPILLPAMKAGIRNIEQELPRKPFRYTYRYGITVKGLFEYAVGDQESSRRRSVLYL